MCELSILHQLDETRFCSHHSPSCSLVATRWCPPLYVWSLTPLTSSILQNPWLLELQLSYPGSPTWQWKIHEIPLYMEVLIGKSSIHLRCWIVQQAMFDHRYYDIVISTLLLSAPFARNVFLCLLPVACNFTFLVCFLILNSGCNLCYMYNI